MTPTKLSAPSNVMSEGTMDRLIWAAWRAFWVGLGASAVLIGQSLWAPSTPPPSAADMAPPAVRQHHDAPDAPAFTPARVSTTKLRARRAS
jgi:hypothetical protein